jgi:predicted small lipoprotein YifL
LLFTGNDLPLTIAVMRTLPLLIVGALLLSACGYRGPLVLPKPKPEARQPAPATTPAPKKEDDENLSR